MLEFISETRTRKQKYRIMQINRRSAAEQPQITGHKFTYLLTCSENHKMSNETSSLAYQIKARDKPIHIQKHINLQLLVLTNVQTHSVQRTLDDDVEFQLGGSGGVLDDHLVLASLAGLDAGHGQRRIAIAGLDVHVARTRRQRHSAVIPRHLGTRRAAEVDRQS